MRVFKFAGSILLGMLICISGYCNGDDASSEEDSSMGEVGNTVRIGSDVCPYDDLSDDVTELSDRSIGLLSALRDKAQNCGTVPDLADQVSKSLVDYKRSQELRLGVSGEWREWGNIQITCNNYESVFEIEYSNALSSVKNGLDIDDTNYFSKSCKLSSYSDLAASSTSGVITAKSQYIKCLENEFVKRLSTQEEACRSGGGESLATIERKNRLAAQAQSNMINSLRTNLNGIYSQLSNPDCKSGKDIAKMLVSSVSSIGSTISNIALAPGSGVAISMAGEAVNFLIDYVAMIDKGGTALDRLIEDKEIEKHICLFLEVQKKSCMKYETDLNYDCETCTDDSKSKVISSDTEAMFSTWENVVKKESASNEVVESMMSMIVDKFNEKEVDIGQGGKKSFNDLMKEASAYYKGKPEHVDKIGALKNAQRSFRTAESLLSKLDRLDSESEAIEEDDTDELIKKEEEVKETQKLLTDYFKRISALSIPTLLKDYVTEKLIADGVNDIEARETAAKKIVSGITEANSKGIKLKSGDIRQLATLTSAMIDTFKPEINKFAKERYDISMRSAFEAEKASLRHLNNKEELKRSRNEAFDLMRDVLKDCISLAGVNYMRHTRRGRIMTFIRGQQPEAPYNIKPFPKRYLNSCAPFLCKSSPGKIAEGIPYPNLTDKDLRPESFGKYQCMLINRYQNLYGDIRKNFIDTGKICGKSISEITDNGKNFRRRTNKEAAKNVADEIIGKSETKASSALDKISAP